MNVDYVLPAPTEQELHLGYKVQYFERLINSGLEKKFKLTSDELYNWIHHNYQSYFLLDTELTLKQFKKLNR